jgi:lysyl endopeptidase
MKQVAQVRHERSALIASLCLVVGASLSFQFVTPLHAEDQQLSPTAMTHQLRPLEAVAKTEFEALNLAQVQREDEEDFMLGLAPRFAVPKPVNITPHNAGTWERLDRQTQVWRLRVEAAKARNLNLGFTRYVMPEGGQLYVYAPDFHDIIRPFTSQDNASHGELWVPPIDGSRLVIELTIPDAVRDRLELVLGYINIGYKPFGPKGADEGGIASGACNVDVACPEGAAWANEIPCVAVLSLNGSRFCTGFLVNNTAQDRKPYLITANHCGVTSGNAPSLVAYWNYQNSFCRTPGSAQSGQPGNGSLSQFSSGSTWRAGSSTASDFTLVEFNTQPNAAWNLSWAGWDRSGAQSPSGCCIHHPNTEEKRITLYSTSTDNNSCGFTGPHVRAFWSLGVTEPGSSGSPLFDSNRRVIGQLHGGPSACGASQLWDCYGRFSSSWTGGGTNTTRLSNWLDPLGTAPMTLNTITQGPPPPSNDNCANATVVSAGTHSFNTTGATTDGPNEPSCTVNGYSQIGADIWYLYGAFCTGNLTVSLCGTSYNAKMAIYPGSGSCPSASGALLACNDDSCGTAPQITVPVTFGNLYRIRIGGFNGVTGAGTMVITCTPTPPPCPADCAQPPNGYVNIDDLFAVINAWGPCSGCAADCAQPPNGFVNIDDLFYVINNWGQCPQ